MFRVIASFWSADVPGVYYFESETAAREFLEACFCGTIEAATAENGGRDVIR